MYAINLIRVFSSHSSILTRPLLSSCQCLKSNTFFVQIVNKTTQYKSNILSKSLTKVSFATSSSPDDNHNVTKTKSSTKRRRIMSNSSSDDGENASPSKAENTK